MLCSTCFVEVVIFTGYNAQLPDVSPLFYFLFFYHTDSVATKTSLNRELHGGITLEPYFFLRLIGDEDSRRKMFACGEFLSIRNVFFYLLVVLLSITVVADR